MWGSSTWSGLWQSFLPIRIFLQSGIFLMLTLKKNIYLNIVLQAKFGEAESSSLHKCVRQSVGILTTLGGICRQSS